MFSLIQDPLILAEVSRENSGRQLQSICNAEVSAHYYSPRNLSLSYLSGQHRNRACARVDLVHLVTIVKPTCNAAVSDASLASKWE